MGRPCTDTPTTLLARSPEDLLALVPVVLGFAPSDSVVMLTFGGAAALPRPGRPARRPRADDPDVVRRCSSRPPDTASPACVFVVYADDRVRVTLARSGAGAFRHAGIEVVEALRADGRRWYPLPGRRRGSAARGALRRLGAPVRGPGRRRRAGSPTPPASELAATLDADPARRTAAVAASRATGAVPTGRAGGAWVAGSSAQHDRDGRRHRRRGGPAAPRDAADLRCATRPGRHEPRATRSGTSSSGPTWCGAPPRHLLAAPAALLGFAAWLAGHGALAWCAVDRCAEVDADYSLAGLASALTQALPPSAWDATRLARRVDPGRGAGRGGGYRHGMVRTFGIEEELCSSTPRRASWRHARRRCSRSSASSGADSEPAVADDELDQELFRHQLEIRTEPATDVADARAPARGGPRHRRRSRRAAELVIVASATVPCGGDQPRSADDDRYRDMVETFGGVAPTAGPAACTSTSRSTPTSRGSR